MLQDAYRLGESFYRDADTPPPARGRDALHTLTRGSMNMTNRVYVPTKLQFQTVLDQVFLAHREVFGCTRRRTQGVARLSDWGADAMSAVHEVELAE